MSPETIIERLLMGALAVAVTGCQTAATETDSAARIVDADVQSRAALQQAVNDALNTNVTLAEDALTETSLLVIERSPPPSMQGLPAQGRNMDEPFQFRLVINGDDCVLIDLRDRSRYVLDNTKCEPE